MEISYYHKLEKSVEIKPGCWHYTLVGIYEKEVDENKNILRDIKVGEYQRNYSSIGPFYAFKKGEKWYALYSKNYMYTRVMSLPDCTDLGGEDDSNVEYKDHFCPMEYYVPEIFQDDGTVKKTYREVSETITTPYDFKNKVKKFLNDKFGFNFRYFVSQKTIYVSDTLPPEEAKKLKEKEDKDFRAWLDTCEMRFANFGFVGGCMWGDDGSMKLQFLDLREVDKGIIKRDERFGYRDLPRNCDLKSSIDVDWIEPTDKEWKDMSLCIATDFRVQVDGSTFEGWWIERDLKKLKEKYNLNIKQFEILKATVYKMFINGLSDGGHGVYKPFEEIEKILTLLKK